jgi:hypothetical protein
MVWDDSFSGVDDDARSAFDAFKDLVCFLQDDLDERVDVRAVAEAKGIDPRVARRAVAFMEESVRDGFSALLSEFGGVNGKVISTDGMIGGWGYWLYIPDPACLKHITAEARRLRGALALANSALDRSESN